MPIDVDLRQWPLVFTRFHAEQTMEHLETYIERMHVVHRRKQPWANISFMDAYSRDARVHRRVAQWMKETNPMTREYCLGVAMVSPSIGFRFVLSTVFLLQPLSCPYAVCGRLEDALEFVRARAAERGVTLPVGRPEWDNVVGY